MKLKAPSGQLQDIKILVADDERMMQALVSDVLRHLGFKKITLANSGRQAIDLASRFPFDFIITDWRMGDMDGIDLIRFLRKSPDLPNHKVPIILLTGNTESHYVLTARDAGVNEYIIKPFTAEQLVKRIRAIIEKPRSFVQAPGYKGPDRRHRDAPWPKGKDRRTPKNKK